MVQELVGMNRPNAITFCNPLDVPVVVVDDVITTGATLLAASDALEQQGAHHVTLAAVASTPAASGAKVLSFHRAPRAVAA